MRFIEPYLAVGKDWVLPAPTAERRFQQLHRGAQEHFVNFLTLWKPLIELFGDFFLVNHDLELVQVDLNELFRLLATQPGPVDARLRESRQVGEEHHAAGVPEQGSDAQQRTTHLVEEVLRAIMVQLQLLFDPAGKMAQELGFPVLNGVVSLPEGQSAHNAQLAVASHDYDADGAIEPRWLASAGGDLLTLEPGSGEEVRSEVVVG